MKDVGQEDALGGGCPGRVEFVSFHYRLSEFLEEVEFDDFDDSEGSFCAPVTRLPGGRFRVEEPTPVTPFGPLGPMLDLGTVIEASPLGDGTFRYLRTIAFGRVWTWGRSAEKAVLEDPGVEQALEKLQDAGARWMWNVGNLVVQVVLEEGEQAPAPLMRDLVSSLEEALKR